MNLKNSSIKVLEDKHNISILLYLYENGKKRKTDIYENISTNARMALKLEELANQNLITLDYRRFENNVTYVELTELGKSVAKKLYEIAVSMSNENQENAEEKRIEEEVERRVAERIAEMKEDEISSSEEVLSVSKENEED